MPDTPSELYDEVAPRLSSYIKSRVGLQDSEDLIQETWIRIITHWDNWQDRGISRINWAFRIAHNIIIDYLRERSRTRLIEDPTALSDHRSFTTSTEARIDLVKSLNRARLSRREKQIIALLYQGYRPAEIARRLSLPRSNISYIMHRTRTKLEYYNS